MKKPLPVFNTPPVVEVALSVQFERLAKLRTPQFGLLWQEYSGRFPVTEEHPALDTAIERFDSPPERIGIARIELLDSPPTPRCWFLNPEGTELIQVQQDRFAHNWRRGGTDAEYPRFERVRETFAAELGRFAAFIGREKLGSFTPNQCELTYVNHIVTGSHAEAERILTVFDRRYSDEFLAEPEDATLRLRYIIPDDEGQPLGRLHVAFNPANRNSDGQPIFVLQLTARGRPAGNRVEDVLDFLDLGHEWIVRGFASITTPEMHREWGRIDHA